MTITEKSYKCRRCGYVEKQKTNHYGPTWSAGHFNCCPECPPWAKYAEFGGMTVWDCMDTEPECTCNETDSSCEIHNGKGCEL